MCNRKSSFFISILILFSGCVSLPKDEQTQNLLFPPSLDTSVAQSLNTSFFSEGEWPQTSWWEIFHSEQLNILISQALSHNPSLQGVEKQIKFAEETAKVTRSELFPLIFFNMDETWQYLSHNGLYRALNPKIPINANLVDLTISFQYEFDFWGKNRHLFHSALGKAKAQEAEAAQVKLIVTTAVAQAYFALKTNLLKKRLYQLLVSVRSNIFELQNLLQEKALLSKLPPLLSEENVFEAQKQLLSIEEEVEIDKHLMNLLIGAGPDTPLEVDTWLPPLPPTISLPKNLSINLLARRPDLMAQIWQVEALANEVGAAKADFFPNINLTAFLGLESTLYSLLFKSNSKTAALQPAIHLPIFTAGSIRANIRAKKASFDAAVYEYNQLILRSSQEVADLLVVIQSIFEQKQKQEQIVKNALERFELTYLRQQSGLDNQFENYAFQEALILKEIEDINLLYTQYLTVIKLIKALGGGYLSDYSLPLQASETKS